MFRIIILLLLTGTTITLKGQVINKTLGTFSESFGTGNLSVKFFQTYAVGDRDTLYNVLIQVTKKEALVKKAYPILVVIPDSNQILMSPAEFSGLVDCLPKMCNSLIEKRKSVSGNGAIAGSCNSTGLVIGYQQNYANSLLKETEFYLWIVKSGTHFPLSNSEFDSALVKLTTIRDDLLARMGI